MSEETSPSTSRKPTHHVFDGKGNRIGVGWRNDFGGVNTVKSSHSVDGREYVRDIDMLKKMREEKQAQPEQPKHAPTIQP
ncbi:hypothetical protein QSV34_10635 [Porticoccus sp. W117]|uniref:hypothetical protein n=1 Tax=Porticoccus sp. W117 TaxID=3054777 RepID=UPI00259A28AE|nr:hypothetical protein [Porticoccus sp. W117]MDM3871807.1 hypothetical protein [Porticoccus sp. W117]